MNKKPSAYVIGEIVKSQLVQHPDEYGDDINIFSSNGAKEGDIYLLLRGTPENKKAAMELFTS